MKMSVPCQARLRRFRSASPDSPAPPARKRRSRAWHGTLLLATPAAAQCLAPQPGFELPGISGVVHCAAWFDDGNGPRLHVGGTFEIAGVNRAFNIARWTGSYWEGVPGGTAGSVFALAVHDDGSGRALYAGGYFLGANGMSAKNVARWNGQAWSPVGPGFDRPVHALAVWDPGSGARLYAGGVFEELGNGTPMASIASWNGATWQSVGGGMRGSSQAADVRVQALHVHDDGTGPALYAGGSFSLAGGGGAIAVARWDGLAWHALGSGPSGGPAVPLVESLATFAGDLHAGGLISSVAGGSSTGIARWDGSAWSEVAGGVTHLYGPSVHALATYDDGSGPALAVGGYFTHVGGGIPAAGLARWDGSAWSAIGTGIAQLAPSASPYGSVPAVEVLAPAGPGVPGALLVGGSFGMLGGAPRPAIGTWDGAAFANLGPGQGSCGAIDELAVHDAGNGRELYAIGKFAAIGDVAANSVARWDGAQWHPLGSGLLPLEAGGSLASFDDGSGPALYAGGNFASAGGQPIAKLARWDGTSWSAVGTGPPLTLNALVRCVRAVDLGSGPRLAIGGGPGQAQGFVHVWDGASWTSLPPTPSDVHDLATFDAGSGPRLHAGTYAGVFAWNGSSWEPLPRSGFAYVLTLETWDDGQGPRLYVGGVMYSMGAVPAYGIAAFDGTSWSAVTSGLIYGSRVWDIAAFDDGSGAGTRLWIAGEYVAGTRWGLAYLDGASWVGAAADFEATGSVYGSVGTLAVHDDGSGTSLFVGGGFQRVGNLTSSFLARLGRSAVPGCDARTGTPYCAGTAAACPCGNGGATDSGCASSSSANGARLEALGQAHVAYDDVALVTSGVGASTIGLVFQGTTRVNGGAGSAFGDGLRCAGGTVIRLVVRQASGGGIAYGGAGHGDPPVSSAGAVPAAGGTRTYQTWYRDAVPFCTGATWNLSNGLEIRWAP